MHPYLTFNGTCAEACRFYVDKLGATLQMQMTFGESPMAAQMPAEHHGRIMHASLTLDNSVLMASDTMPGQPYAGMHGFALSLAPATIAEAERLFAALGEGGTVLMPLAQTFWAARFGMVTDRFGVPWMVNCESAGC